MAESNKSRRLLLFLAYVGFVSLGLPDTVVGVAWPFVRSGFHLEQSSLGLVFFGAACGYFISSTSTGKLLRVMGVGTLLAVSSGLVAVSGLGFATAPAWLVFASFSVIHGLGSGAIDSALNYYVAQRFSARHMNWLHACYSLGATLGPLIMTAVLTGGMSWRAGYATVGGLMVALTLVFASTRHLWNVDDPVSEQATETRDVSVLEVLRHRVVRLQVLFFLVYTGLEVTAGQWSFTLLTESRGFGKEAAGIWVSSYWGSIGVGRVFFGYVVERVGIDRLLRTCTITACIGAALILWSPVASLACVGLIITGLSLAPIYPCMMTRTPQRMGAVLASHAIGFQVAAAMIGAAALPSFTGWVVQLYGAARIGVSVLVMTLALWLLHEGLMRCRPVAEA